MDRAGLSRSTRPLALKPLVRIIVESRDPLLGSNSASPIGMRDSEDSSDLIVWLDPRGRRRPLPDMFAPRADDFMGGAIRAYLELATSDRAARAAQITGVRPDLGSPIEVLDVRDASTGDLLILWRARVGYTRH